MVQSIFFSTSLTWSLSILLSLSVVASVKSQQFNYEIEKRIRERLDFFLSGPVETVNILVNFREFGGFANGMGASDRDEFLKLAYSVTSPLVYYGLEDGTIPGYYWANGYYREPGNSGYSVDNAAMEKHLNSCIDGTTGEPTLCLLEPGADYISCWGGEGNDDGLCKQIDICPNQPSCESDNTTCYDSLKWCRQYSIMSDTSTGGSTGRGYVPITNFCLNGHGQFSQEEGNVIDPSGDDRTTSERVSCTYADGSLVQRYLEGDYAACGNQTCDTVFEGGYSSSEYDPRYRPWYYLTKEAQKPLWLPPYSFFTLGLGVTYTTPLYAQEEETGRQVFAGVMAVDYRLEDIASFLVESYGNATDTAVIIYEVDDPHYIIASSTASDASRLVLSEDPSLPCPVTTGDRTGCEPIRTTLNEFGGHPMDTILVRAAEAHEANGYPKDLISVKASNEIESPIYVSQSTVYNQAGTDLSWRVVVVASGADSTNDTITKDNTLFGVIIFVATLGIGFCSAFAILMYRQRKEKAIVFADWRFTCAFIVGCILFNASTYTLLGENTDVMCILRMWTFHLFFVVALSPLFVKVWRMYKLVGSMQIRRNTISNVQASLYTLPMIMFQVILLLIITLVDPPRPMEDVQQDHGMFVHSVTCGTDSDASFITLGVTEFAFVFAGCVLAYMTRNMEDDFGEAKQMIFSMYNIFFVGLITVIVIHSIGLSGNERSMLQAVGVFWGTVFSAGAFAIPRLLQARQGRRTNQRGRTVRVSGIENPQPVRSGMGSYESSLAGSIHAVGESEVEPIAAVSNHSNVAPKAQSSSRLNFAGQIEEGVERAGFTLSSESSDQVRGS